MRLIVAAIQDYDAAELLRHLTERGWGATQVASTGGALRSGTTTVMVGVPEAQVRQVLRVIDEHCRTTAQPERLDLVDEERDWYPPEVTTAGGAIISVLKVVRFERL
jgi:uncharacterized protein YaaQ